VEWVGSGIVGMMVRWMAGGLLMRMGTPNIISILGRDAKHGAKRRSPFSLSVPSLPSSLFSSIFLLRISFFTKKARCAVLYDTFSLSLPNTEIGKVERPLLVGKLLFASGLLFLYYFMIPGKSRFLLLLFFVIY
jgi:hypothetical protein